MENLFGFEMNEEVFASMQKEYPWFDMTLMLNNVPPLKMNNRQLHELDGLELKQFVFSKIFGSFGNKIDLDFAIKFCYFALDDLEKSKPQKNTNNKDGLWSVWMMDYAAYNVLLATAFSYKKEYIKAAYHFFVGLKTEAIGLNMPYTDFIKYIISKIDINNVEEQKCSGIGFSSENYMGSNIQNNKNSYLNSQLASKIIPQMTGKNGEVILAKQGRIVFYGFLKRIGSKCNTKKDLAIDLYETFIIDKNYNLKRIVFYFNNYMTMHDHKPQIKIADGFKINEDSLIINDFDFIQ